MKWECYLCFQFQQGGRYIGALRMNGISYHGPVNRLDRAYSGQMRRWRVASWPSLSL